MTEEDHRKLVDRLYARRGEAVVVPFVRQSVGDWSPSEGDCHRNVNWFAIKNEEYRPVRGWLVFDFQKDTMGLMQVVRFTAHSVVEDKDGNLFDITPSRASQRYPFLKFEGTEEEFVKLVQENNLVDVDWT